MKVYTLSATYLDRNQVRVHAEPHSTLGNFAGRKYLSSDSADEARETAEYEAREYYPSVEVSIDETEEEGLIEGDRYDVWSVAAVMLPLPEGCNVKDFFGPITWEYLGADVDGVGIRIV